MTMSCQEIQRGDQGNVKLTFKSVEFEHSVRKKIPNHKHQITNKFQYSMTKTFIKSDWNFRFWSLEFIWNLYFGAWDLPCVLCIPVFSCHPQNFQSAIR